jgi:putative ABC transport system permease protein
MLKLAIRNVVRQRWRTALTLAAIALGVTGLVLAGGFVQDVYVQLAEATIHSQYGHLQIYRRGYYEHGARKPLEYALAHPGQIIDRVRTVPHVREAMLRLDFSALLNNGRDDRAVVGEAVEPEKEARLGTYVTIVDGRPLDARDAYGMLVGEGVAKALNLKAGSHVSLVANTSGGSLNTLDFDVVGVFRTFSKDFDDRAVRVSLEAAHSLLDTDAATSIVVVLDSTGQTDPTMAAIARAVSNFDVEIKPWYALSDFYDKTIALYQRQFGVLQLITLAMVLLCVMNSISMTTFERASEFGTMRALGNSSARVFGVVLLESAVTGVLGALVGIAIAVVAAVAISAVGIPMPPPPNAESGYIATIRLVPHFIAGAAAIGIVATVLGAVLPARRIARMPVVEALQQAI